tara:strand:- start:62 stop:322 length:261 start_codon:yes stop_codon:yes gene_type:complete
MKEKILPSLKNIILIGLLIWIGLILGDINENLSPQRRFKKTQLMCAKWITQYGLTNKNYGKDLAKFAGIPNEAEYLANYCIQIQKY